MGDVLPAKNFKGYFTARFSQPFDDYGTSNRGVVDKDHAEGSGADLAGWVTFDRHAEQVDVRIGVSFISIEQARRYAGGSHHWYGP